MQEGLSKRNELREGDALLSVNGHRGDAALLSSLLANGHAAKCELELMRWVPDSGPIKFKPRTALEPRRGPAWVEANTKWWHATAMPPVLPRADAGTASPACTRGGATPRKPRSARSPRAAKADASANVPVPPMVPSAQVRLGPTSFQLRRELRPPCKE